jgi:hypothetical protein
LSIAGFAPTAGAQTPGDTLTATPASLDCGTLAVGTSSTCGAGTITLTANGGPVVLASPSLIASDSVDFSTPEGSCLDGLALADGDSCTVSGITFTPGIYGALTDTVTFNTTTGTGTTFALAGSSFSLTLQSSSFSCPPSVPGTPVNCGTLTLTAEGGAVTLDPAMPFAISDSEFTIDPGTCIAGAVLAAYNTCTTGQVVFTPDGTGAHSVTISAQSNGGNPAVSINTAGVFLTISTTTLTCPTTTAQGPGAACGTISVTAEGGSITLGTPAVIFSDNNIATTESSCADGLVLSDGQVCTIGVITYQPQITGSTTTTVTVNSNYNSPTATVSGTGIGGTLVVTPGTLDCGSAAIGASVTCSAGTVTLTAKGGPVIFSASPFTSSDTTDFTIPVGGCTPGATMSEGDSCTTGTILFNPTVSTVLSDTVTVTVTAGTGTSFTLTGGDGAGTPVLSATGVNCGWVQLGSSVQCTVTPNNITITATNGPVTLDWPAVTLPTTAQANFSVAGGNCVNADKSPLTLPTGASCTLGVIGFAPTSNGVFAIPLTVLCDSALCTSTPAIITVNGQGFTYDWGTTAWTPTNGCTDQLYQTRTVYCQEDAGASQTTVDNSYCTGDPPAAAQWTAQSGFAGCSYQWVVGPFTPAGPLPSCSDQIAETRIVQCEDIASGAIVDGSHCTGARPANTTVVSNLTGCNYAWSMSAYSGCGGGSCTYSGWSPTVGCGTVTQTRTCLINAGSGVATRTATCVRGDGVTVSGSYCAGLAIPATSQSCTPSSCSCGTLSSQSIPLTNGCNLLDENPAVGNVGAPAGPGVPMRNQPKSAACTPNAAAGVYCIELDLAAH